MDELFKDMVHKFYQMDPKTDDMLPNGLSLARGMKVLIGVDTVRVDIRKKDLPSWEITRALTNNRWCTVVSTPTYDRHNNVISFVGLYEDGIKAQLNFGVGYAWYVKKDSIADSIQEETYRYRNVHVMVGELLASVPPSDTDSFNEQVKEITEQLLRGF